MVGDPGKRSASACCSVVTSIRRTGSATCRSASASRSRCNARSYDGHSSQYKSSIRILVCLEVRNQRDRYSSLAIAASQRGAGRLGLPALAAGGADRGGHVGRSQELFIVGVDDRSEGWSLRGPAHQIRVVHRPVTFPLPPAFLNQPQPRDVFQQPEGPGNPPLAREVIAQDGPREVG